MLRIATAARYLCCKTGPSWYDSFMFLLNICQVEGCQTSPAQVCDCRLSVYAQAESALCTGVSLCPGRLVCYRICNPLRVSSGS